MGSPVNVVTALRGLSSNGSMEPQEGSSESQSMSEELPADVWRMKAMSTLQRVTAAERRFAASIRINEITMLAAADELEAATKDARVWLSGNRCPDPKLGAHLDWMLSTCTEVALTAQRAVTGPFASTIDVMERLADLLTVVEFHSQTLDTW